MKNVLVAGAGIVGVSTAIWLQRAGYRVTLVEREGPAAGTSFGNAGVLAAGARVPVTVPTLWKSAPGMLLNPNSPLFLCWSYLPQLLPFLARYMAHANDKHVRNYAKAMAALLNDAHQQHLDLAAGTGAEKFITADDYCFGYQTEERFQKDAYDWAIRKEYGVEYDVCQGKDYALHEPLFDGVFEVVVRCKKHGKISDPGAYVKSLSEHFVAQGGSLEIANVVDIAQQNGKAIGLQTERGIIDGDKVVLTTGAWSTPLLQKTGLHVPLESERGYHIELINPSHTTKSPMMVASGKFVITPMVGRIRCAGIVEFGGLKNPPSNAPLALIKRQVAELLPHVSYDAMTEWLGHRPAPADSLPLIGAIPGLRNAFIGMGHQHVGLTGGAKTGQLIADIIGGTPPAIDLSPFDPLRYKK